MRLKKEFSDLRLSFEPLTLYQKFDPTGHAVFQALFGMIFTVIIARTVVLIAVPA